MGASLPEIAGGASSPSELPRKPGVFGGALPPGVPRSASAPYQVPYKAPFSVGEEKKSSWVVGGFIGLFFVGLIILFSKGTPSSSQSLENISSSGIGSDSDHEPGERKVVSVDGVDIALHWCPPGSFLMGSPETEDGRDKGEERHRVKITHGFWMGETEVTQGLWTKVMGENPSGFKLGDNYPVENVSWDDCQSFLKMLNAQVPEEGFTWVLPTEAQWEYACRAGTTTAYFWGNVLNGDKANCDGNYPCGTTAKGPFKTTTTRVGSYDANPWGFFDMHGNVWEWCADRYGSYPSESVKNPPGASSGSYRVARGGSWFSPACQCRSARRNRHPPNNNSHGLGLRVALVPVR